MEGAGLFSGCTKSGSAFFSSSGWYTSGYFFLCSKAARKLPRLDVEFGSYLLSSYALDPAAAYPTFPKKLSRVARGFSTGFAFVFVSALFGLFSVVTGFLDFGLIIFLFVSAGGGSRILMNSPPHDF